MDYELFQLRTETAGLDAEIEDYLSSPRGRFEQWYAEHDRESPGAEQENTEDEPG